MKKKMKLLIVEDTPSELELLLSNLNAFESIIDLSNVVIIKNYEKLLTCISSGAKFDITILDKFLGSDDTFNLFKDLQKDKVKFLGFILLKTRFKKHLGDIKNAAAFSDKIEDLDNGYYPKSLAKAFAKIQTFTSAASIEILLIPNATGLQRVEANSIMFIEVTGKYSYIHFVIDGITNMLKEEKSLSKYEDILDPNKFYRIHDKYLVNREYIFEVQLKNVLMKFEFALEENMPKTNSLPIAERRRVGFLKCINL
jgi:DNA-binding LytR/AlgR family response regulator